MKYKHKQIWAKVNCPVDEKIAKIVSLFNTIDGLMTLDSCEGDEIWSYIYFKYGNYKTICNFVFGELMPILTNKYGEDIFLSVESADSLEPIGKISFRKELTNRLYTVLRSEINAFHK